MTYSRRRFMQWAASVSVLAVTGPGRTRLVQVVGAAGAARGFELRLLPSEKDVWDQSYFPYSGQTPAAGVTGELVYADSNPTFTLTGLQGRSSSSTLRPTRATGRTSTSSGASIRPARRLRRRCGRRAVR